jgi:DNA-binding NtrC family response regulator
LNARLLLIDDEPDLLETLQIMLEGERLDVTTAANGQAGVEALRSRRFDLVVTDLRMPGLSGVDTIAALRAIDPDVPVIVATGCGHEEAVSECRKSGVCGFICKPFDFTDFVALVRRTLA